LFDAAGEMTLPRRLPVTPGLWWTSLLIGVYNLGERRGAIFRVRFCDVLFDDRRRFPAGYVRFRRATRKKGLRLLKVPLNDSAKLAIEAMRRGREEEIIARPETLIWGLPIKFSRFHKLCRDLLSRAGAPKRKRNGLHRLRKSMANAMAGISLLATQRMLGHADFRTTKESYIGDSQTSEAVTRLPQPPRVADMLSRTPKPDPRRNMVDRKFPPAPGQVEIPLAE
jgi:integrase